MSNHFDWQTDDESENWDDGVQEWQRPLPKPRYWPYPLILLIFCLVAFFLFQQTNQRVTTATSLREEDIRAGFLSQQQAITNNDLELFKTTLSASQPSWTNAQLQLFEDGLLAKPWSLNLTPHNQPRFMEITLVPELIEAEVQIEAEFTSSRLIANPEVPFSLQKTLVFRQGSQRWLHSPPRAEFWGASIETAADSITLIYPAHDSEISQRLLADLDASVRDMCANLDNINCPADLHFEVQFTSDPNSLKATAVPQALLQNPNTDTLRLPTPSLIGIPTDDRGYQALLNSYAPHVVAAAINSVIGYECCERGLIYRSLLHKQLEILGLPVLPTNANNYQELLWHSVAAPFDLPDLYATEPTSQPDSMLANLGITVVDYVETFEGSNITELQRGLLRGRNYWRWLNPFIHIPDGSPGSVERDWLRFVAAGLAATPPPVPLPTQAIQLLCSGGNGRYAAIWRYDLTDGAWTQESEKRPLLFMSPLPDDSGVLLQEREAPADRTTLLLWQNNIEKTITQLPLSTVLYRTQIDANIQTIFSYDFTAQSNQYHALDIESCDSNACDVRAVIEPPAWETEEMAAIASVIDAFTPYLPNNTETDEINIHAIESHPHNNNLLYILLSVQESKQEDGIPAYLFSYDQTTNTLELLTTTSHNLPPFNPLDISSNGRWALFNSFLPQSATAVLYLHNLESNVTQTIASTNPYSYPGYDWSADGNWLLRVEDGFIHLLAPEHKYQQLLVHDQPNCNYAAWVNNQ